MGIIGAVIGALVVAFLNTTAAAIPEALQVTAVSVLVPAATILINTVMPVIFWLAALAGKRTGFWGRFWRDCATDHGQCGSWRCSRNLNR